MQSWLETRKNENEWIDSRNCENESRKRIAKAVADRPALRRQGYVWIGKSTKPNLMNTCFVVAGRRDNLQGHHQEPVGRHPITTRNHRLVHRSLCPDLTARCPMEASHLAKFKEKTSVSSPTTILRTSWTRWWKRASRRSK